MPHTTTPGPAIYYELEGPLDAPALVLIEGLSTQLIGWRQGLRAALIAAGVRLVLLDNRDVGLSVMCDALPPYGIDDMADDVVRVLDDAGIDRAHVLGQSMGGAIAQSLAVRHGHRLHSLVLFYTAPVFSAEFVAPAATERPVPTPGLSREEAIAVRVEGERACGSPLYGFDEDWARTAAAIAYDRNPRVDGIDRQRAALIAFADRRQALATVDLPCAVIHGRGDAILRWQGSVALAEAIPGADLHLYDGLGHVVAEPLWPQFVAIVAEVVARGERRA